VKASRILLYCLMTSSACLPASGMSPSQTVVANPDPQLSGASPLAVRETRASSASQPAPTPAMSSKKKTVLLVVAGLAVVVLAVVLLSGGNGYGGGY
jgi:hypothetical protein